MATTCARPPVLLLVLEEVQKRFVDERRGLQRLAPPLATEISARQPHSSPQTSAITFASALSVSARTGR